MSSQSLPLSVTDFHSVADCDRTIESASRVLADLRNTARVQSGDPLGAAVPLLAHHDRDLVENPELWTAWGAGASVEQARVARDRAFPPASRAAVADHIDRLEQIVRVAIEARAPLVAREAKRGTQPSNPEVK